MARIYLIEDDQTISDLLQIALRHQGHDVEVDLTGSLDSLDDTHDLVLLDLTLPETDGLELARRIRGAYAVPIIMLTVRDQPQDKLEGFEAGADDYVTKPFVFEELSARIRAVLKRTGAGDRHLSIGPLALDLEQCTARWRDELLSLTPREFALLATLARRPGRVFRREELLDRVWGFNFEGESNVVEVTIRRLREKLGDEGQRAVMTVRGFGYTMRLP